MKLLCVIPAYNEKNNLKPLIAGLFKILPKVSRDYEILFIIQGNDGSKTLLRKLKKKYRKISWIYFPNPLGVGRAYKTGFDRVTPRFSHVLTLDADLNHDPKSLPLFIRKMNSIDADLVVGSRFMRGGAFRDKRIWKKIISKLTNKFIRMAVGLEIHDISSGYRLIKSPVIIDVRNRLLEKGYPNYMELLIKSSKLGYKMAEVPIVYEPRIWGKSKMGKMRTFIDYLFFSS